MSGLSDQAGYFLQTSAGSTYYSNISFGIRLAKPSITPPMIEVPQSGPITRSPAQLLPLAQLF